MAEKKLKLLLKLGEGRRSEGEMKKTAVLLRGRRRAVASRRKWAIFAGIWQAILIWHHVLFFSSLERSIIVESILIYAFFSSGRLLW